MTRVVQDTTARRMVLTALKKGSKTVLACLARTSDGRLVCYPLWQVAYVSNDLAISTGVAFADLFIDRAQQLGSRINPTSSEYLTSVIGGGIDLGCGSFGGVGDVGPSQFRVSVQTSISGARTLGATCSGANLSTAASAARESLKTALDGLHSEGSDAVAAWSAGYQSFAQCMATRGQGGNPGTGMMETGDPGAETYTATGNSTTVAVTNSADGSTTTVTTKATDPAAGTETTKTVRASRSASSEVKYWSGKIMYSVAKLFGASDEQIFVGPYTGNAVTGGRGYCIDGQSCSSGGDGCNRGGIAAAQISGLKQKGMTWECRQEIRTKANPNIVTPSPESTSSSCDAASTIAVVTALMSGSAFKSYQNTLCSLATGLRHAGEDGTGADCSYADRSTVVTLRDRARADARSRFSNVCTDYRAMCLGDELRTDFDISLIAPGAKGLPIGGTTPLPKRGWP
ncbi:MAG: hypothetical protein IPP90_02320 [Gemmatimonadaceae bacterium]|nr:hypothetical protein [Gemmatimonadaceae bacterium]